MYYIWRQRTGSALFSVYVLTLGVLFGYIFPGIGTNVLHLWKFNGPLRMKNYFLHHGFMYAPYLALCSMLRLLRAHRSPGETSSGSCFVAGVFNPSYPVTTIFVA